MREAKTETGLALYDEACKLDAGIVTPETEKTILALLEKAIACGCKEAFEMFGIYNLMGWGMYRPNYRKAGRFLEQASRRKSFSSYVDLAWCYYYGHGVPRRRRKAFALYLKAAMQGSELGMYNVGTFYEHGERCVVRKDPEKAVFWYREAATKGNADATFKVGYAYDMGKGVTKDKKAAVRWYRLAASKGSGDAMWNLSAFYEKGLVVRRNCAYAAKLRAKAALLDSKGF